MISLTGGNEEFIDPDCSGRVNMNDKIKKKKKKGPFIFDGFQQRQLSKRTDIIPWPSTAPNK